MAIPLRDFSAVAASVMSLSYKIPKDFEWNVLRNASKLDTKGVEWTVGVAFCGTMRLAAGRSTSKYIPIANLRTRESAKSK